MKVIRQNDKRMGAGRAVLKRIAVAFAPVLLIGSAGYDGQDSVQAAGSPVVVSVTSTVAMAPNDGEDTRGLQPSAIAPVESSTGRADALSFPIAERFGLPADATAVRATAVSDPANTDLPAVPSDIAIPESRKEMAVRSEMTVFGLGTQPQLKADAASPSIDPALIASVVPERVEYRPRADLLDGVPEAYAQIAEDIARQEGVDVNLMLSIMHAENAGFDPVAVSPAGAIGLMQVMPATGQAFGAHDLTDPAQNIRAGARFLKVLVEKYRNPVLIASAYHAGEPQVDVRTSLPLIRETADYVTKVVGLYTNSYTPASLAGAPRNGKVFASAGKSATVPLKRKTGKMTRVSSSMLIYSASEVRSVMSRKLWKHDLTRQGRCVSKRRDNESGSWIHGVQKDART
jgi:soluble lytic murein transglycosylase-like protein